MTGQSNGNASHRDPGHTDVFTELRMALAEADTEAPEAGLRQRVVLGALARREAGRPLQQVSAIDGLETFRRATSRMARLLDQLDADEWTAPTIRGLSVQGLVGHLIGVEEGFADAVSGDSWAAEIEHVSGTDSIASSQDVVTPRETLDRWRSAVDRTVAAVGSPASRPAPVRFHRLDLPLDAFLVVRSFEMWTHEEDVQRATGRPVSDPEPESLRRMTDLATDLLPAGVGRIGASRAQTVRLVLTGAGGGAWDVPLEDGMAQRAGQGPDLRRDATVVVDAAAFCRVVANRSDLEGSHAVCSGDIAASEALFGGAAALALD